METSKPGLLKDSQKYKNYLVLFLIFTGFLIRLLMLKSLPYGLNQDEASSGYDAFALLTKGIDRNGVSFPVLFVSWGSGQNALMAYLAMPFIALFGLNEVALRLPNAIFSSITLIYFWLYVKKTRDEKIAIMSLLFLVFCPWHIMISRWALESNLLPCFLMIGAYYTALAEEDVKKFIPAAIAFGLALYTYGTAFFLLPIFLVVAVIKLRKKVLSVPFFIAFACFVVLAAPIDFCNFINMTGGESVKILGITLPKLTQPRQNATSVFSGEGIVGILKNYEKFFHIVILQSDPAGKLYKSLGMFGGGLFYFFGLPCAIYGLYDSFRNKKLYPLEWVMTVWLICSFLCSGFIDGNVNRLNMCWIPLIYFAAVGFSLVFYKAGRFRGLPFFVFMISFLAFGISYVTLLGINDCGEYYQGLGDAIRYCAEDKDAKIFISNDVNQPYIFALFYTKEDPEYYLATAEYENPNVPDVQVRSYGRFVFGSMENSKDADYLILRSDKTEGREVVARYKSFAVCKGKVEIT